MKKPCITVVIPVYQVASVLPECLNSISQQSFQDYEVILVDDGSLDAGGRICDRYKKKFPKLFRVYHTKNHGLSAARNYGIERARGKYITFIDSDDVVSPHYLEVMARFQQMYQADIVQVLCSRKSVDDFAIVSDKKRAELFSGIVAFRKLLKFETVKPSAWGKLYRTELFREIKYPARSFAEDSFTTYKLMLESRRVVCVPDILYYYRQRPMGIMLSSFRENRFELTEIAGEIREFVKEKQIDYPLDDVINFYEIRQMFYTYHQCIRFGEEKRFRKQMEKLSSEIIQYNTNIPILKLHYKLLRSFLEMDEQSYQVLIRILEKIIE